MTFDLAALLDAHAPTKPCALVPSISAWHADDEVPLWEALDRADPPFFCVAWPGAQALAKLILGGVVDVKGRTVLDIGCGSGVASIAAALSGARVTAVDVDPLAVEAAQILARRHGVTVTGVVADGMTLDADLILAADLIYSATQLDSFRAFVAEKASRLILADSGRPFFDACGLDEIASYVVDVPKSLEGVATRTVRIYRRAARGLRDRSP